MLNKYFKFNNRKGCCFMLRFFDGFCPALNKNVKIKVEVIPCGTLSKPNLFAKGLMEPCSFNNSFCLKEGCIIYKNIPDNFFL